MKRLFLHHLKRSLLSLCIILIAAQAAVFIRLLPVDLSAVDRLPEKRQPSGINPNLSERAIGSEHGQDLAQVHLPNRRLLAEHLRAGGSCSREEVGEWETACFYPVNWIYF